MGLDGWSKRSSWLRMPAGDKGCGAEDLLQPGAEEDHVDWGTGVVVAARLERCHTALGTKKHQCNTDSSIDTVNRFVQRGRRRERWLRGNFRPGQGTL
jgi:hypothetical protein